MDDVKQGEQAEREGILERGEVVTMGDDHEPWRRGRTTAVCAPHEPNRGVAVRFLRQTEPWDVARFGFRREPNRTVRGSNHGQH